MWIHWMFPLVDPRLEYLIKTSTRVHYFFHWTISGERDHKWRRGPVLEDADSRTQVAAENHWQTGHIHHWEPLKKWACPPLSCQVRSIHKLGTSTTVLSSEEHWQSGHATTVLPGEKHWRTGYVHCRLAWLEQFTNWAHPPLSFPGGALFGFHLKAAFIWRGAAVSQFGLAVRH